MKNGVDQLIRSWMKLFYLTILLKFKISTSNQINTIGPGAKTQQIWQREQSKSNESQTS